MTVLLFDQFALRHSDVFWYEKIKMKEKRGDQANEHGSENSQSNEEM